MHVNHMPEVDRLVDELGHVIVVEVDSLRLEFLSLAQLREAVSYFQAPSGSTRMNASGGDHWEFQPWQSRLPSGIINKHKRPRILRVLELANEQVSQDVGYRPASA